MQNRYPLTKGYSASEMMIDMFSQEIRDALDKEEPFSESELISRYNSKLNMLRKIKNNIEFIKMLEELENKYQNTEISKDVLEILVSISVNDIDFDKVRELLNAS